LLDTDTLETYLHATPEPVRSIVVQLARGASPKDLLISGKLPAATLEDVLSDLSMRGAVVGVSDDQGADLLGPEIAAALEVLHAAPPRPPVRSPSKPPQSRPPMRSPIPLKPASSLADAVMREISDRPARKPIVEPTDLRPRSNPPMEETQPFDLVCEVIEADEPSIEVSEEDMPDVAFFDELEEDVATDLPAAVEQTEVETLYEAEPMTPSAPLTTADIEKEAPIKPRAASTGLGWFLLLAVVAFSGVFIRLAMASSAKQPGDLELPAGAEVMPGDGMLEIAAPPLDVMVDGVVRGRGPHVVVTLQAGTHELTCGAITKNATIVPGRMRKIDVSSP
jgi:hypothetical protein